MMKKGKVFCSSDWHGTGYLADKVFDFLKPDDTLYFLGDAIDRNPDGVKIFQALMDRPNTFYIKGNHDEMMARCIPSLYKDNLYNDLDLSLWYSNGGSKTASALECLSKEDTYKIKKKIDTMPTELIYTSPAGHTVIMEHAGYTPFDIPHRSHDPLWDRDHFYDKWDNGFNKNELNPDTTYLVHGHTPVQYLKYTYGYEGQEQLTKEEMKYKRIWYLDNAPVPAPTIIRYCDNHKFDVDMCTIVSNRIALLDLDTFEEIYFDGE